MALTLVCKVHDKTLRHALTRERTLLGSDPACDFHLPHPTVSRRHAALREEDGKLWIEDLGSSNGTRWDGRRLRRPMLLEAGSEILIGQVSVKIEQVRDGDLTPALALPGLADSKPLSRSSALEDVGSLTSSRPTTLPASALEKFTLEALPQALTRWRPGAPKTQIVQALGEALFQGLPCLEVVIFRQETGATSSASVLFKAGKAPSEEGRVEHKGDGLSISASFFPAHAALTYRRAVELVHRLATIAWASPGDLPRRPEPVLHPPPLPAPPSLDSKVREIYGRAARVAQGTLGILIRGESGTGKEILARYCHGASRRASAPFVALNCAALPSDLLEMELFGIEDAVATGVSARPGKFELADGGTLFLDEIGDMAAETQAKILRVLQEREVYRLGGSQARRADVRILSATHQNLEQLQVDGRFRGDLYHRIAGWEVHLPPLRERLVDLPNLAIHFLAEIAETEPTSARGISQSALDALLRHSWPGNIRQLQQAVARAALFVEGGGLLQSTHFDADISDRLESGTTLRDRLEQVELAELERALALFKGDARAAADHLGIARSTLYRRLKMLGGQGSELSE